MAIVPSYFSTLAESQNIQAMIDNSLLNLQKQSIWRDYLDLGLPQMDLTFEQAIGRDRIEAAASIVDPDASKPLRSRPSLDLLTGKIPSIQQKFKMSQTDMRTMEVLKALPISDAQKKMQLLEKLFNDVSKCATAGDKRVDIMTLQALSTLTVTVDATTNPDGVAFGTVDLLAKGYQKQGVPVVWSTTATSTPIDDINKYLQYIWNNYGRTFSKILMPYNLWINFMNSAQVIARLQSFYNIGKANASFAVTLDNINNYFMANLWPPIEIIQHTVGIEKNGVISPIRPFDDNNLSFLPAGKLGELKNALPMERLHPVEGVSYANFGATLVSKWRTNDPIQEWTGMELNAFPALDVDGIFILKTETVQASFNGVGS